MHKFIIISITIALLAVGWWFTTLLVAVGWLFYGAARLLMAGAEGGAW